MREIRTRLSDPFCRGLILAGPPGVGKTRLANEALKVAERMKLATARATGTQASSQLPLGAFASLLSDDRRGDEALDHLAQLIRHSANALLAGAGDRRLVLLVDDAHLLDGVSATLVHQIASGGDAFILATIRTGEVAPDPVTALWKDGLIERIDLQGLGREAVGEVLCSALGDEVDPGTVAAFHSRSRGNMLFLRELVLGALEEGTLSKQGEPWRLASAPVPSGRLLDLVEARLGGLDPAERSALEVVSLGEPMTPEELDALSDPEVSEHLERKGLLSTSVGGFSVEVRLAHPIYGEAIRARMPLLRARTIALDLANVVEAAGLAQGDILRVATWRLQGGLIQPDLMLEAAHIARWRFDLKLAERLARAALAAGAGFEAIFLVARVARLQGQIEDADAAMLQAAEAATTEEQRWRLAIHLLDDHAHFRGNADEALRIADEAEADVSNPNWRDEIAAKRAGLVLGRQGPRSAAEVVEPLLERATGRASVWSALIAAQSLCRLGRFDDAIRATERGATAQAELESPLESWHPWLHTFERCEILAFAGKLHEAEEIAQREYEAGLEVQSAEAQAWFALQLARTAAARGRVRTAALRAQEALTLFRDQGRPVFVQFALGHLAIAQALRGNFAAASKAVAEVERLSLPQLFFEGVDLAAAQAWTAVADGDVSKALRILKDAVQTAREVGDVVGESLALHIIGRLGLAAEVTGDLEAVAAKLGTTIAAAQALHVRGNANHDPDDLLVAAKMFEACGADLFAAEAVADAAVEWRRHGRPRQSADAERRAAIIASRCEGAKTPGLQSIECRASLTRAERETAMLAASGRSNKEISAERHLSVRTVENHLCRVYAKLGIEGRDQLAEALLIHPER